MNPTLFDCFISCLNVMANWKLLELELVVVSHWLLAMALGAMTSEYSCLATCGH